MIDLLPDSLVRSLSAGLTVLTSMITPALLISASGTFVLSTSNRLGRVIDRVRSLSVQMEQIMGEQTDLGLLEERRDVIFRLIDRQTARASLLARALMIFYVATGTFVASSVAIGVTTLMVPKYAWLPVVFGLAGTCLLLAGSLVLVVEARKAMGSLRVEREFLAKLVDYHMRKRLGQ